jgi:integrase
MQNQKQKEKHYALRPGVYIYLRGNRWMLRYRIPVEENGVRKLRDVYKTLASRDEYNSPRSVEHLANPYLDSLPDKLTTATTQTVLNFIEHDYLPHAESENVLAPSTIYGYKHLFSKHLKDRLGAVRLCDFRTATGQTLLNRIASETELSHTSLRHIKWFLVAALKYAKQTDALQSDGNPMVDTTVPKSTEGEDTHAYSLKEIQAMLAALVDEPVSCTVVATAAFTGLRMSELRGLRWKDLRDRQLNICNTVWGTHEREKTKTASSKAPVPVLPVLTTFLEAHRSDGHTYIFQGAKLGRPLNLSNLARRVIVPKLAKAGIQWCGWQAFRRGLATNLYNLSVPEHDIQAILRHADIETTRRHYIKRLLVPRRSKDAIRRLERAFKGLRKRNSLGTNVGTARVLSIARKRRKAA